MSRLLIFSAIWLVGCALGPSTHSYSAAKLVGAGSNSYLSNGYTSDKVLRSIDYPGKEPSDEIHFVTYSLLMSSGFKYSDERLLAAYRATELAIERGFDGISLFSERPPFSATYTILTGESSSYNFHGQVSPGGVVSGTAWQVGKLEGNRDRGIFGTPIPSGAGYYAVLSRKCKQITEPPYTFVIDFPKYSPRESRMYVLTQKCIAPKGLREELAALLYKYIK